jgi:hypothetical protein
MKSFGLEIREATGGWRYCRAVVGSKNKVHPNLVLCKKQVQEFCWE